MIILENLTCGYTQTPILSNINWQIKSGEHWVVTCPMAAGKTSLLQAIAGKLRIFHGKTHYHFLKNPESFEERRNAIHLVSFTDTGKLFHSVNAVHYYQQRYQAFDSDGHLTVKAYLEDGGLDVGKEDHRQFLEGSQRAVGRTG